jgi:hypothetical protein
MVSAWAEETAAATRRDTMDFREDEFMEWKVFGVRMKGRLTP